MELSAISPSATDHCAYCEAPLPADLARAQPSGGQALRYCCYGCRLLGESGNKPVADLGAGSPGWFRVALGAVISGQTMLLGLAVNLAPPTGLTRGLLHLALMVSSLTVFAILGRPLGEDLVASLRQKRISIELLFFVGIIGAFLASLHSTLAGTGAIYYEVVAILLTVYAVGKTLGAQSRARALAESRRLQSTFELCQKIQPDGTIASAAVATVEVGDCVRILPGEPIPIDGRVSSGQAFVRETPLTGEPFPVARHPGDLVFAGSYSEDGELIIAATAPGHQRRLDQLLSLVERARGIPSTLQAQADRIVRWFLPAILLVAAGAFLFWTVRSGWSVGLFNAMAVLLVACPCAMGLATPIAIWNALGVLAARGLVVQNADVIDRLARLTHVVFDKTGTLSEESLSLIDLAVNAQPAERQSTLDILAAVQRCSSHPVARAFRSLSISQAATPGIEIKSLKPIPARGLEAWIESASGQEIYVRLGQREFMTNLTAEATLLTSLRHSVCDHLVYVALDGQLCAIAAVRERLRSSTADAIDAVTGLGLECSVMTGDCPERAIRLGLSKVEGSLTSDEKAARIQRLQQATHRVAFVGDGINDAPAIRAASVGIALGHGAGLTTANAGAVLYGGDLGLVPWAIRLCRQVQGLIRSNLIFAAAYNLVGVVLAAAGLLHPVVAALLMVASSFTVSWRALRSSEVDDTCCAKVRAEPTSSLAQPRYVLHLPYWVYGLLVALQAPFLIYLGAMTFPTTAWFASIWTCLGLAIACFPTRNSEWQRNARMTFAMLGPGNWGMILGWWADAGFGPVTPGCPHCQTAATFALSGLFTMPWMNLGMVLLGLLPMVLGLGDILRASSVAGVAKLDVKVRLGRFSLALLSGAGMLLGMSFGSFVAMKLVGTVHPQQFLISFIGMTVGMLLGMFFCCELGRAIVLWVRSNGLLQHKFRIKSNISFKSLTQRK